MTTPKTPKATAASAADPATTLQAAIDALVIAAEAFAAADGTTTHSFAHGDYRVRFQGEQLLSVSRT